MRYVTKRNEGSGCWQHFSISAPRGELFQGMASNIIHWNTTMSHGAARASLIADLTKSVNFDFDLTTYAGEYHRCVKCAVSNVGRLD